MTDSCDGLLPRMEEEVSLHEVTLRSLSNRKELLELQVEMARLKNNGHNTQLQSLQERRNQLEKEQETYFEMQREGQQTLDRCQERLGRIAPRIQLPPRKVEKRDFQGQTVASISANLVQTSKEKEPGDVDSSVEQQMGLWSPIPSLHCDRKILEEFWSCSGRNGVQAFLPCFNSSALIRKVLNVSALETLALDVVRPESSTHRAESLRNTCLDVFASMCLTEYTPQDQTNLQSDTTVNEDNPAISQKMKNDHAIDPNVALCPYELAGICADIYCPYQHLKPRSGISSASMIARERLPLPPLRITAPSNSPNSQEMKISEDSARDLKRQRLRTSSEMADTSNNVVSPTCATGGATSTNVAIKEQDPEPESCIEWQRDADFVALPPAPSLVPKREADQGEFARISHGVYGRYNDEISAIHANSSEEPENFTVWWVNDEDVDRLQRVNGITSDLRSNALVDWLYMYAGFRIFQPGSDLHSAGYISTPQRLGKKRSRDTMSTSQVSLAIRYEQRSLTELLDIIAFIGRVIDCIRVAIHAGRFDLAHALHRLSRSVVDGAKEKASQVGVPQDCGVPAAKAVLDVLGKVTNYVIDATQAALCYNSDPLGVFHRAFDMHVALAIVSEFTKVLYESQNKDRLMDDMGTVTEWEELLDEMRATFFVHNEHIPFFSEGECQNSREIVQSIRDELLGVHVSESFLGKYTKQELTEKVTNGELEYCKSLLSKAQAGKSVLVALSQNVESEASAEKILQSSLLDAREVMRGSADISDGTDPFLSTTIFIGYLVLGTVRMVAKSLIRSSQADYDANRVAMLSELDAGTYHIASFLRRQVNSRLQRDTMANVLIAPLCGLSASLCACLGHYGKTQLRLEAALSSKSAEMRTVGSLALTSKSVMEFSDLMWSQLVQLRACLPLLPNLEHSADASLLSILPDEVSEVYELLSNQIMKSGVNLNHFILHGDWKLVMELNGEQQEREAHALDIHSTCHTLVSSIFSLDTGASAILGGKSNDIRQVHPEAENDTTECRDSIILDDVPLAVRAVSSECSVLPRSILLGGDGFDTLSLKRCQLIELPETFGLWLNKLQELDISENNLSELPESIGQLTSLRILIAAQNKIKRLPPAIVGCVNLEFLDLRMNALERLPTPDLPLKLTKLKTLLLDRGGAYGV